MKILKIALISLLFSNFFIKQVNANDIKTKLLSSNIYNSLEWHNLLHYINGESAINKNSTFFLSSDGYKNPKSEYIATINEIFNSNNIDNDSVFCKYPARIALILEYTNLNKENIPQHKCSNYDEYVKKVPFEDVSVIFASENNISPSTMLGHSFLKIDGNNKSHSFSYFAAFDKMNSFNFYIKVLTSGVDGMYILSPYKEKSSEYINKENRSLWEFKLKLSVKEKMLLKQHLWELKDKNIKYKFVSHNCNTALINILKTANIEFSSDNIKPFITPVEYIQELQVKNKISNISIEPSVAQKNAIQKFGLNYVGNAPKPMRLSFSQDLSNNISNINFSPVYQDIRDISDAYFPDLESKMLDLSFNYYNAKKKVIIDKIDILKMQSVIDYQTTNSFSKYFRFGFENNLFSNKNSIKPIIELGLGIGKKISSTSFYILPKIGYHYDNFSNFYINPQVGFISRINDKTKLLFSYEKYFNSKDNNIGFEEKFNLYLGYKIQKNSEIYIDYSHFYNAKNSEAITTGVTFHF